MQLPRKPPTDICTARLATQQLKLRFRTHLEGGQFVLLRQGQEVLAEGQEVLTAAVAEAGTEIMPLCKQAK